MRRRPPLRRGRARHRRLQPPRSALRRRTPRFRFELELSPGQQPASVATHLTRGPAIGTRPPFRSIFERAGRLSRPQRRHPRRRRRLPRGVSRFDADAAAVQRRGLGSCRHACRFGRVSNRPRCGTLRRSCPACGRKADPCWLHSARRHAFHAEARRRIAVGEHRVRRAIRLGRTVLHAFVVLAGHAAAQWLLTTHTSQVPPITSQ